LFNGGISLVGFAIAGITGYSGSVIVVIATQIVGLIIIKKMQVNAALAVGSK
jgi:hypothetical protein